MASYSCYEYIMLLDYSRSLFRNLNEPYTISLIGLIGYPVILLLMIMGGVLFLRGASFQRSMLKKGLLLFGAVILTYLPILIMFLKGWYSFPFI